MRFPDLTNIIKTPYFHSYQLSRLFPAEASTALRFQLSRFVKRGILIRLKRGIYVFPDRKVDEFVLASITYQPSYISLETALHLHGIIPDIPAVVTSISPTTSNQFTTPLGVFSYSQIDKKLYFGFVTKKDANSDIGYNIAEPEKALLDWIYIRKIKDIESFRVDMSKINLKRLSEFATQFPSWVQKEIPHE